MKTINVAISDVEYNKFGLKSTNISFSELIDIISREIVRQKINDSVDLSEKFGLSSMTMSDISKEVKAARENAKNNR
jgi:predicted CopG family antitoxin